MNIQDKREKSVQEKTDKKGGSTMKLKKAVCIAIGCLGLALGAVGAVLPLLPAFPFLLLAAIYFGKSSERLDNWFKNTKLYKNNLESFVKGQGMTWKTRACSHNAQRSSFGGFFA